MPRNPPSSRPVPTARRSIAPLWILFIAWSIVIAFIWFGNIGEAELRQWFGGIQTTDPNERIRNPQLFAAFRFLLSAADTIWIILGTANIYLSHARREGLARARRWAIVVLVSIWVVSAISVWTGWPMGAVHFTSRLGMKLGPVPLGWVLLLYCLILGARDLAAGLARNASHLALAILTGVLLAVASLPLALVAWKIRAWLIWYPGIVPAPATPPIQFCITFLVLGFLIAWLHREQQVARTTATIGTPAAVFLTFVAFLGAITGAMLP